MKKVIAQPTRPIDIFSMVQNITRLAKTMPMKNFIPALDRVMLSQAISDREKIFFFTRLFLINTTLKRHAKLSVLFDLQPNKAKETVNLLVRWAELPEISDTVFKAILDHVNKTPFSPLVIGDAEFSSLMPLIMKLRPFLESLIYRKP